MPEQPFSELNQLFAKRYAGEGCPLCGIATANDVIAELPSGFVRFIDDADRPGYCILVARRHVVELHHLSTKETRQWAEDVRLLSIAVENAVKPVKINLAMFGNLAPHLHCHVIPRFFEDPDWIGPPAFPADADRRPLHAERITALKESILHNLTNSA